MIWGGEPTRTKREAWESSTTLIAAVIWLVVVLLLAPRALRIEAANEDADTAAHVAAIGGVR